MAAINQLGGMPGQSEEGVPQQKTVVDEKSIAEHWLQLWLLSHFLY